MSPKTPNTFSSTPTPHGLALVVVKRDGSIVPFRRERIEKVLELAFRDTYQVPEVDLFPLELSEMSSEVASLVIQAVSDQAARGDVITVEGIQDLVELKLLQVGEREVARDYILYRDKHKALREDSPYNLKIVLSWRTHKVSPGQSAHSNEHHINQEQVRFNPMKIAGTLEEIFRLPSNRKESAHESSHFDSINLLTAQVVEKCMSLYKEGRELSTEIVSQLIEETLMESHYFQQAKEYILRRAKKDSNLYHPDERLSRLSSSKPSEQAHGFTITNANGQRTFLPEEKLRHQIEYACRGYEGLVSSQELYRATIINFYEGIREDEIELAKIMAARSKIEHEPAYTKVAAALLLDQLYREALSTEASDSELAIKQATYFQSYIHHGIAIGRLHPQLGDFDLTELGKALRIERDLFFDYIGLQTLYDRYFIHQEQHRLETPQIFWMRVAMGLALNEGKSKTLRAIEFYEIFSKFLFSSSTPTLFNSGTVHPQLSSCYLLTVGDDLKSIFKLISDDAQLSKWAGGLGNDWTPIRATGSYIKGTNGQSQGVIPFLKIANDTAIAVNQGGKRKGAMCAYLEVWHLDIEDFIELRKNTGDDRRRTHDMNTATWIPDLFMQRVKENGHWTLFSPADTPDLHDLYGQEFLKRYSYYEGLVDKGIIKNYKRLEAVQLWRKILSMLFETGHPWITFKDPSNIRSPQDHVGVVHSSNLCTEILLNTSSNETAVCNLGSINLAQHVTKDGINVKQLQQTIRSAIRMLDNVIDINFYPIEEARAANLLHRPIGLGIMGFQDALYIQGISYASHEAVEFADQLMELISYYAILSSSELARERGTYVSYPGSKWDRGLLPIDTIELLAQERGGSLDVDRSMRLDWTPVRQSLKKYGMRNSNTMAIAPTATIGNIFGVTQSIEPMFKHLFVKSNLSGEFTIPNVYLVSALKELGLWDQEMLDDLKYFDGSIAEIHRIPQEVRHLFPTAFEVAPEWVIECASRRQKWIDMGQSLNLYLAEPSGKKLDNMYFFSWIKGLKTTYYLRTLSATTVEKSTMDVNKRGLQPRWMKSKSASGNIQVDRSQASPQVTACPLDGSCESCQ
jgi:ribonucleoside-diphosphate reductase alpha chain